MDDLCVPLHFQLFDWIKWLEFEYELNLQILNDSNVCTSSNVVINLGMFAKEKFLLYHFTLFCFTALQRYSATALQRNIK